MYSKQKEEFFKLVKSTEEPMYQGYDFIDYTLLCVHCPSFSQLTEEEAMDFIKSLGFAVVNFTINQEKLDPAFSIKRGDKIDDLKTKIDNYLKEEELYA